jgi:hypothetical protein
MSHEPLHVTQQRIAASQPADVAEDRIGSKSATSVGFFEASGAAGDCYFPDTAFAAAQMIAPNANTLRHSPAEGKQRGRLFRDDARSSRAWPRAACPSKARHLLRTHSPKSVGALRTQTTQFLSDATRISTAWEQGNVASVPIQVLKDFAVAK